MAMNFTIGDALTNIGGGVFQEVLENRRRRQALRDQMALSRQQQDATANNLQIQQAGATERERIQQEGQNSRNVADLEAEERKARRERIRALLFGDDEFEQELSRDVRRETAITDARERTKAKYDKSGPTKVDGPEDYMAKVKTIWPETTPKWQRRLSDLWRDLGDYGQALEFAGEPENKPEDAKAPDEGRIARDTESIYSSWVNAGRKDMPGGDDVTSREVAGIMARHNVPEAQAIKIMADRDAAMRIADLFKVDSSDKRFDGKSIADLVESGMPEQQIIQTIRNSTANRIGSSYRGVMGADVLRNTR